jgi:predicted GNAT superfamily acetyltransferase
VAPQIEFGLERPPWAQATLEKLVALSAQTFERSSYDYVAWRMTRMPDVSLFLALAGDDWVGFKIGYATSQTKYYSWLGGVKPEFRRRGIASELLRQQHRWLADQGYETVETAANQRNVAMAQVNLAHGFVVCGTRVEVHRTQVLLSKTLTPPATE